MIDSFNTATGGTIRFGDSVEATFTPGSCIAPGTTTTPTGKSRIEILPLRRKGDFIKFFKPTTTSDGSILETGGGLFIRVIKDDKELSLAPGTTVKVRFTDVDPVKTNMQGFYGKEGNPLPTRGIDTAFSWFRDVDTTYLTTWFKSSSGPGPGLQGYEMNAKNLRWIAAEHYIDSTQPKTKLTAILSPNYTNKNTAVFAVFANQKTVVNLHADYASRSFFANNVPLKTGIILISLSKIGDDLYLGIETIGSLATATSHTINPEKKSLKDILAFLNNL